MKLAPDFVDPTRALSKGLPPRSDRAGKPSERRAVVLITDKDIFYATRRLIRSLQRNWPDYPELVVLHRDLEPGNLALLHSLPRTRTVDLQVPDALMGPAMRLSLDEKSDLFYGRFLMWSDTFREFDKLLYLDVDGLVLDRLDPLFERDFYACINGTGTLDVFVDDQDPELKALLETDGLEISALPACNAGVLLLSRPWLSANHLRGIRGIVGRYRAFLRWADQSVVNIWMSREGLPASPDHRYNYQLFRMASEPGARRAMRDVAFMHFNGFHGPTRRLVMMLADNLLAVPVVGVDLFWAAQRLLFRGSRLRGPLRTALTTWTRIASRFGPTSVRRAPPPLTPLPGGGPAGEPAGRPGADPAPARLVEPSFPAARSPVNAPVYASSSSAEGP